jgi:hypothetical protein
MGSDLIEDPKPPPKRVLTELPVEYFGAGGAGRGVIRELSQTGALIGESSMIPETGAELELSFRLSEEMLPVAVPAEVVSTTPKEFEVTFTLRERRVRDLLKLAISNASRSGENVRHRDLLRRD